MATVRDRDIKAWPSQRRDLYKQAKLWGLDDNVAFCISDRELQNWTGEDLSAVFRKMPGYKPSRPLHTMPPGSAQINIITGFFTAQRWIKPPDELVRQSAREGTALCINRKYEFSLQRDGYFAISHVWIEGIQGDKMNRGLASGILDRIFEKVSVVNDIEWLWLDVVAIPTGYDALTAAQELEKIDIINSLGSIYDRAAAIIIFDALLMLLNTKDLVDAVTLLCGKWMSRIWTYQEIKLARRAIVLTGSGPVEFQDIIAELKSRHNGLHWDADLSRLKPEQMPARYKYRLLYMALDNLQYDEEARVAAPDVAFVCRRRQTGNAIDYARAFFPVLELKWKPGMTKQDGMRAIYDARPYGYNNAARLMLMFGRPRTMVWPGWAPDTLCGLDGMIFVREAGFQHLVKGLTFKWNTFHVKSLTTVDGFTNAWLTELSSVGTAAESMRCALFRCNDESDATIRAVEDIASKQQGYLLTDESLDRRGITGILVGKDTDVSDQCAYAYMVIYVDAIEFPLTTERTQWTIRNENPMNQTLDGGRSRVAQVTVLNQDNRDYTDADLVAIQAALSDLDVNSTDSDQRTALHKAAALGDLRVVENLISRGVTVDAVDSQNATALNLAADKRRPEVVARLLDAGADINHKGRIGPPLTEAIVSHTVECVRILLQRGAVVEGLGKDDFLWPLILASDQPEVTALLLEYGADPNRASPIGLTALHFAARSGNALVVKQLIAKGARLDRQLEATGSHDPLRYAIETQSEDVAAELLFNGANPDAVYGLGMTPLIVAAQVGNAKIVRMLLDVGANVHQKANGEKTALDFAREAEKRAVIKLLTEHLDMV